MTALDVFTYADHQVRTVLVDGEPWFVAADVAAVLGYSATEAMTRSMDDDERGMQILQTPGGAQRMVVISESGLYDAILRSRVPAARDFKRWVKHDVLPSIRRSGGYNAAPAELSDDELMLRALTVASRRVEALTARAEAAEATVAVTAPKAEAFDSFLSAAGDYSVNEAAKVLSRDHGILTGEKRLRAWMIDNGWVYRGALGKPRAYQTRIDQGVLAEKAQWHFHPVTGERVADVPQVRVTPKGLERLRQLLTTERAPAVSQ